MFEKIHGLQHIGLPSVRTDETVEFYEAIGFTLKGRFFNPNNGTYVRFMEKGGLVIEIYEAEEGEKLLGAIDHIALDVEDLDALHAYAVEKGFNIVEEGSLPFWDNGIRYFTVLGPNNEKVEFSEML